MSGERLGMTVSGQHAGRARFCDCFEQRRPVSVVGEHKTPIERALAADAPHAHQPGGKGI